MCHKMNAIQNYVYTIFQDDTTGHDFFHMQRVARLAITIAEHEEANVFICHVAGWVHDIGDKKLFSNGNKALEDLRSFLQSLDVTNSEIDSIFTAIHDVSFSKGNVPSTMEGKIVQDADRLDALGAIGIARTFAYGGSVGQLIHHDTVKENTSVQHFYDKLLKLKDKMNTNYAKQLADKRHRFMETYLSQFLHEWNG